MMMSRVSQRSTSLPAAVGFSVPRITPCPVRHCTRHVSHAKPGDKENLPTIVIEDDDSLVGTLLSRDRAKKDRELTVADTDFAEPRPASSPVDSAESSSTMGDGSGSVEDVMRGYEQRSSVASTSAAAAPAAEGGVLKSKSQRRRDLARSSDAGGAAVQGSPKLKKCKDAIDAGLALFQKRDFDGAIDMFNAALELPGNGAYRLAGSPREYSCPSVAEENAALYNMACAYAQQSQTASALTCLEAVMENGFEDFATVRTDPDLAPLRGAALDALLNKFDGVGAKMKKMLGGGQKDNESSKPWFLW